MTLFDRAICFAVERHSGQTRKLSQAPYILHPLEAAAIVGTMTEDEEVLAAAVLHDTIEDTDTMPEEISAAFGKRVMALVYCETEDKRDNLPPEATWRVRKEETLAILHNTKDISVKMMWLGDKLSNVRSLARQYDSVGNKLWDSFHQKDPVEQEWYYRSIINGLSELKDYPAYREFVMLVDKIFSEV